MRFWWVNHKQTARQELTGGYLWSPKTEARGTRSQFYDNTRRAAPGDIVLSYAAGLVGRVGVVTDFALEAQKPTEFGSAGSYWDTVGWLLPIAWFEAKPVGEAEGLVGTACAAPARNPLAHSASNGQRQSEGLSRRGRPSRR
jgi:putative restriction endonuclease